ncbi:hypothetical protein [uncultured Mucilaginibacter sp.]|uniref:hypothetical protein n=1 Tax=uncultured Mucilaginibacter sp. TaxID=797541 RepID=UPI00263457FC|nr:hypothetical protein [uncultured Mucilaginibacter sp.]
MKQIKPKALFIYFTIVTLSMFILNVLFKIYTLKQSIIPSIFSGLLATCFFYFFIKLKLKRDSKLEQEED